MSETKSPRKKWLAAALIAGLAVLMPATIASATSGPNAQLVTQDRVYGGGQYTVSPGSVRNFAIDAHAQGGAAYGNLEFGSGPILHFGNAQVTCLKVVGNSTTVGGIMTDADPPDFIGWAILWVVQDNGNILSATSDAATLPVIGPLGDPDWSAGFPYVCPSPDTSTSHFGLSYFPLNAGDLVVQNAASS
jgi:hypothetical protein